MAKTTTGRPEPMRTGGRHLTVREFAAARRCSEKTVRRRIAEGALPVVRTGRRIAIHARFLDVDL